VTVRFQLLAIVALTSVAHADGTERHIVITAPQQTNGVTVSPYIYLNRCLGGCPVMSGNGGARADQSQIIPGGSYVVGEFQNAFGQNSTANPKGTCVDINGAGTTTTCTDDSGCTGVGAGAKCDTADTEWQQLVACMTDVYSPYAVTIVADTTVAMRPTADITYTMAIVGGSPSDTGFPNTYLGVAPLANDCSPQNNVIAFAFANVHPTNQHVFNVCWTAAQETAHAFGLDHEYVFTDGQSACNDPMTYRNDCGGEKFFRNKDAQCGGPGDGLGPAPRLCKCGGTQNSHAKLVKVFGAGQSIVPPPTTAVTFPADGASVVNNWNTAVDASSQRGVTTVELWLNGYEWTSKPGAEFGVTGQPVPSKYSLVAPNGVPDGAIQIIVKAFDDLGFEGDAAIMVQKGASCADDSSCAVGQHCNTGAATDTVPAGGCYWDPPAGVLGDSCTYPQYCNTRICNGPEGGMVCTEECTGTCPGNFECDQASDGKSYCYATSGGCCSAGGAGRANGVIGLLVLAIITRRKRDKSC
jgi:hypothetical protein